MKWCDQGPTGKQRQRQGECVDSGLHSRIHDIHPLTSRRNHCMKIQGCQIRVWSTDYHSFTTTTLLTLGHRKMPLVPTIPMVQSPSFPPHLLPTAFANLMRWPQERGARRRAMQNHSSHSHPGPKAGSDRSAPRYQLGARLTWADLLMLKPRRSAEMLSAEVSVWLNEVGEGFGGICWRWKRKLYGVLVGAPDSAGNDKDLAWFFPCHLTSRLQRHWVTDETLLCNILGFRFHFITMSHEPRSVQRAAHIYSNILLKDFAVTPTHSTPADLIAPNWVISQQVQRDATFGRGHFLLLGLIPSTFSLPSVLLQFWLFLLIKKASFNSSRLNYRACLEQEEWSEQRVEAIYVIYTYTYDTEFCFQTFGTN